MSKKKKDEIGELKQEIDILNHMLSALVETLEEKGHRVFGSLNEVCLLDHKSLKN